MTSRIIQAFEEDMIFSFTWRLVYKSFGSFDSDINFSSSRTLNWGFNVLSSFQIWGLNYTVAEQKNKAIAQTIFRPIMSVKTYLSISEIFRPPEVKRHEWNSLSEKGDRICQDAECGQIQVLLPSRKMGESWLAGAVKMAKQWLPPTRRCLA